MLVNVGGNETKLFLEAFGKIGGAAESNAVSNLRSIGYVLLQEIESAVEAEGANKHIGSLSQ